MKNATEQQIQKAIIDYLKLKKYVVFKHRNVGIFKKETQQYIPLAFGEKGITDIIACDTRGRFWGIEVKRKGGRVSPEQTDFIARIRKNGGIAFIAYSIDDVIREVEKKN
jgi:RecB family endonuclease NucS